jgi:hypothetical protein
MATFDRQTGYGRTRRPKAITKEGAILEKETAKTVTVVAAASLNDSLNDTTAGENGYSTENQRYLHIQIENDAVKSLTVYGYNYAFGSWAVLYIPVGTKSGADTTAELAYVAATFDSISGGKKLVTIPLQGIDRIGFTSADAGNMVVRAACSSF